MHKHTWLVLGDKTQCSVDNSDSVTALPDNLQHGTENPLLYPCDMCDIKIKKYVKDNKTKVI